jgi:hypothetical protein
MRSATAWISSSLIALAASGYAGSSVERAHYQKGGGEATAAAQAMPGQASFNRNIRERIAGSVEGMMMFRGILDGGAPRLLNTKMSVPFEWEFTNGLATT